MWKTLSQYLHHKQSGYRRTTNERKNPDNRVGREEEEAPINSAYGITGWFDGNDASRTEQSAVFQYMPFESPAPVCIL